MVKIGSKNIKTNIFLAPLAGCADLSFRLIARALGAEFCFYEMADSNSLVWNSRRKTADMFQAHPEDLPIAAQLLGSDPEIMLTGAKKLLEYNRKISFLDINAACPVKKVVQKRAGAHLLREPELLYGIISKLSSSLHLPITVKLRSGYLKKDIEAIVLIAKRCEEHGAKALFVHGRTMAQGYAGEVDYESIRAIKESVKIPVIGSGNILSPQKAKEMMDLTGCDGILVARGAFGNPWIFKQIKTFLNKGILLPEPGSAEKAAVSIKHIQYVEKYKQMSPRTKLGFARKVALWYLKGFKNVSIRRGEIVRAQSIEELLGMLGVKI
jgi:nifR3 family TIM-barrel protein